MVGYLHSPFDTGQIAMLTVQLFFGCLVSFATFQTIYCRNSLPQYCKTSLENKELGMKSLFGGDLNLDIKLSLRMEMMIYIVHGLLQLQKVIFCEEE